MNTETYSYVKNELSVGDLVKSGTKELILYCVVGISGEIVYICRVYEQMGSIGTYFVHNEKIKGVHFSDLEVLTDEHFDNHIKCIEKLKEEAKAYRPILKEPITIKELNEIYEEYKTINSKV